MPKITKTSAQTEALQTIISDLKLVNRLNAVMLNTEILEAANVQFSADGEKVTLTLQVNPVNKILGDVRKEKIAEIKALSKKYAITLDDADQKILSDADTGDKKSLNACGKEIDITQSEASFP